MNATAAESVKNAGGAAVILTHEESQGYSLNLIYDQTLPMSQLSFKDAHKIKTYLKHTSTSTPTAKIVFQGTQIGDPHAPFVASYSSRGPNTQSPGIIKPDIIGPGSNIIIPGSNNIMSGTSISCPHLSGVAALLKSTHPDWSPAAIKSAIMTTADRVNHGGKPIEDQHHRAADPYSIGSGHVNPTKANNPGLVYDLEPQTYIPYLCGLKYTDDHVSFILKRSVHCSNVNSIEDAQLNYPSFSINLGSSANSVTYTRTVTNVGEANSSYRVKIVAPRKVKVKVEPKLLVFSKLGHKLSYKVSFTRLSIPAVETVSHGLLSWISADHVVASPIGVTYQQF